MHVDGLLCGRADDLGEISARFDSVPGGLVLLGPAGIGKSRLAHELLAAQATNGRGTVRLRCTPATADLPFAVLAPVLSLDIVGVGAGMPMLVAARRALREAGRGGPVVIGVDDLPEIDEVTALLLAQMIDAGEAKLIGTYRNGAFVPSPIAELWHRGVIDRITVGPLDRDGVVDMATATARRAVDERSADRLFQLTHGNPLHVTVALRAAREADSFERIGADGTWSLGEIGGSTSLGDFVNAQLDVLDEPSRRAIELLALGEPLDLDAMESIASVAAIAVLEEQGLAVVSVDGRRHSVRLAHPLYGEALRANISRARARRAYRDLSEVLRQTPHRRRDDLLRIALWSVEGGSAPDDSLLVPAARRALFAHDNALAERLARLSMDRTRSFEAAQILSDVYWHEGRDVELGEALSSVRECATTESEIVMAYASSALRQFWRPQTAVAGEQPEDLLSEAERRVRDPAGLAELAATRASVLANAGRGRDAVAIAEPLLEQASGRARMHALVSVASGLRLTGRATDAIAIVDAAAIVVNALPPQLSLLGVPVLLLGRINALLAVGRYRDAMTDGNELLQRALNEHDTNYEAMANLLLGLGEQGQGNHRRAIRRFEAADALLRRINFIGQRRWVLMALSIAAAQAGDATRSTDVLAELDAIGAHPAVLYDTHVDRARAWNAHALGHPARARGALRAAVRVATQLDEVPGRAEALHDLARLGEPAEACAGLTALRAANGPLVELYADHAAALARDEPSELASAAERFGAIGAHSLAAEAARESGDAFARAGYARDAKQWAERSRQFGDLCDVGLVVIQQDAAHASKALSRREREVATLTSSGLTSREVAARLFVSSRTVDNHLGRIFDKLGVRTRRELAALVSVSGGTQIE